MVKSIDIHAHISPEGFINAAKRGEDWYGTMADASGMVNYNPKTAWSPEERLKDMDSIGVDVHVLSTNAYFYNYDKDAETVTKMSREANDYVSQLTKDYPTRFAGLANLPMQDVKASVAELERSVTQLGLKGAMIGDHVNGKTYDDRISRRCGPLLRSLARCCLYTRGDLRSSVRARPNTTCRTPLAISLTGRLHSRHLCSGA